MEQIANLHIKKLPEGVYLATSDGIPGLIAQGRTTAPLRRWKLRVMSPGSYWRLRLDGSSKVRSLRF